MSRLRTTYRYDPLPQGSWIRILILLPALRDTQPLKVELREIQLVDEEGAERVYEALSYTWGARNGTIPISCEGETILVTPNCESALRHLRHRFTPRHLWIDAICIDQGAVEEKNQQVSMMGDIYTLAKRTIIWLGAGGPGDAETLSRAKTVGGIFHFRTLPGSCALGVRERAWARKVLSAEEIERIGRICQSDWFQRIWTVQEFLLSENGAVFMVGRKECAMSQLYTYFIIGDALLASDSRERRLFRLRNLMMENIGELRAACEEGLTDEEWARKRPSDVPSGCFYTSTRTSHSTPGGGFLHMLSLTLQIAAMSEATDPRDKVYGVLAFVERLADDMYVPEVDYDRSIEEVYEDFAISLITSTETLFHLEHISGWHHHGEEEEEEGTRKPWPSWVPDLRSSDMVASPREWCSGLSGFPQNARVTNFSRHGDEDSSMLGIQGRRMTRVSQVFARMPMLPVESSSEGDDDYKTDMRTSCLSEWTAHATQLDMDSSADDGQGAHEAKNSTYVERLQSLTPYLRYLRDRHEPEKGAFCAPSLTELRKQYEPSTMADLLKATFSRASHQDKSSAGRRFDDVYDGSTLFSTRCGLLGLCRGDVRVGDEISQLVGARYPFVLRRIGDEVVETEDCPGGWPSESPPKYRLVGAASLDRWGDAATRPGFWYEDFSEARRVRDILLV